MGTPGRLAAGRRAGRVQTRRVGCGGPYQRLECWKPGLGGGFWKLESLCALEDWEVSSLCLTFSQSQDLSPVKGLTCVASGGHISGSAGRYRHTRL